MQCPRLLLEVAFERMVHVSDAGPDRVEGLERAHKRAGRKYLDLDAAAGRGADRLGEANCAGVKARRALGPVGHHLQLPDSLRNRGRREASQLAPAGAASRIPRCVQNVAPPHGWRSVFTLLQLLAGSPHLPGLLGTPPARGMTLGYVLRGTQLY